MSDSFADLWASSAPTKSTPQQPPKKTVSSAPPLRQQYDAFSILSASQPSSKPVSNNQLSNRQGQQPQPTSNGGDAFSDLFASSFNSTATSGNAARVNMTMAERAVLAQKAKIPQSTQIKPTSSSNSLWDGLDALARPSTASPRPPAATQGNTSTVDSFDFEFDRMPVAGSVPSTMSPPNNTSIEDDDWGLSEFASPPSESRSAPAPSKLVSGSQPTTLWDLDEFSSSEPQGSHPQPQVSSRSLTGTPGDFDFGDREDGLLGGDNSDVEDTLNIRSSRSEHVEDDILGDLGKPLSHSHSPSPSPSTSKSRPVRPSRTSASPPPHITGQLVEMGFSPIDARAALVSTMTENGFDAQAATEMLLSQASQEGPIRTSPRPPDGERRKNGDSDRAARPPPMRTDSHPQPPSSSQSHLQSQPQLDITAEKLLSQASEIGRGMFSKANALWKEGKERAVKMYEERAAAPNGASTSDGRPRWMREHDRAGGEWQCPDRTDDGSAVESRFKYEDEEQGREQSEKRRPPARRPPQSQSQLQLLPPQPEREREVNLFSTDTPTIAYQSPFRRGKPKSQALPPSTQSFSASTPPIQTPASISSDPSISQRPPQPPRTFTTTISLSALTTSTSHKSAGTDAFKRGDFPVALAAYMRALSALPSEHILRVPILTNIGLVQSKVGELRDTIKACEEAIVIVRRFVGGTGGGGGMEEMSLAGTESNFDEKTPMEVGSGKVSVSVQGESGTTSNGDLPTSVDLVEGLSKAFRRRAEALESLEKWEMARSTWDALLGAEWVGVGVKGEAVKGVGRCRRMVGGGDASGVDLGTQSAPPKPKPKPNSTPRLHSKPTPTSSTSTPPSAALTALRSAHNAQQTEDSARLACKDAVDARLTAWKSGREGNIRALLTFLDETVLWPELGWRKVGMAEVVSKGQVKGAYVRAIAKVHPDKLNAENTTVEQRMVANGVFGALNEAWNVFQQQQQ